MRIGMKLSPGMLDDDDEKQLIADAESKRIGYIVLTKRSTLEYGVPISDWIMAKGFMLGSNSNF